MSEIENLKLNEERSSMKQKTLLKQLQSQATIAPDSSGQTPRMTFTGSMVDNEALQKLKKRIEELEDDIHRSKNQNFGLSGAEKGSHHAVDVNDEFRNSLNLHDIELKDHEQKISLVLKGIKRLKNQQIAATRREQEDQEKDQLEELK